MHIMKKIAFVAVVLLVSMTGFADTYATHFGLNAIGDFGLVTLGRYTFANPVTFDLAPTNAPRADAVYSVRCQVIYVDSVVQDPKTDDELEDLRLTGDWLNDQLQSFIDENLKGGEYEELLQRYYEGGIGIDIDRQFRRFVEEHQAESAVGIEVVKVQISAEDDLRRDLIRRHNKVRRELQSAGE